MPRAYIQGKRAKASCALINELKKSGIAADVGYAKKNDGKLLAYVRAENVFRVPRQWRGFKVEVHVDKELL